MQIEYGTTQHIPLLLDNGQFATEEITNDGGYLDALIFGRFYTNVGHSGVGVQIYGYGSLTGNIYTGMWDYLHGAATSGSFNDFGLTSPMLLKGVTTGSGQHLFIGPVSVARGFGGILPYKWGLKIYQLQFNGTKSVFGGGDIFYMPITYTGNV